MKKLGILIVLFAAAQVGRSQVSLSIQDVSATTTLDTVVASSVVSYDVSITNTGSTTFSGNINVIIGIQDTLGTVWPFHTDSVAFAAVTIAPNNAASGTITHDINMAYYSNGNNITVIWPETPNASTEDSLFIPTYVLDANGIIDQKTREDILIYPNPSTDVIYISPRYPSFTRVEVFSPEGKRVMNKPYKGQPIGIRSLSDGLYFIHFYSKSRKVATKKFLKK